jgi:hypothetical protein
MNKLRLPAVFIFLSVAIFFSLQPVMADDPAADNSGGNDQQSPATLVDVHKLLQQAGDYQGDTPPPKQADLLNQALKEMHRIHHTHGQMKQAVDDINAALSELTSGNNPAKVKSDIQEADDIVRQLMES